MNEKYIEMLKNGEYYLLANLGFINELVEISYNDKYLIEYLLEKGIHSEKMDNYVRNNLKFAKYYLQYGIINPLINCSLKILMDYDFNNNLIIDTLLDHLDNVSKLRIYQKIKENSYSEYYEKERDIVDIFLRHGIILPTIFVEKKNNIPNKDYVISEEISKLLEEFYDLFYVQGNEKVLNFIIGEFKRCLEKNTLRTLNDIKKLMDFKRKEPSFCFIDSEGRDDCYDKDLKILRTNTMDEVTFAHEFSHFLYYEYESENEEDLQRYEALREEIFNAKISNIINYLDLFHQDYEKVGKVFEEDYFALVEEKYGDFKKYIEVVCKDMLENMPSMLKIWNANEGEYSIYMVDELNIKDIVLEFLTIEKEEYVRSRLNEYYAEELMVENIFDALLMGALFDGHLFKMQDGQKIPIKCLSGHGGLYYIKHKNDSFDECMANFDAINKSSKGKQIVKGLRIVLGEDMIDFLNNYIKKNRESVYEHR